MRRFGLETLHIPFHFVSAWGRSVSLGRSNGADIATVIAIAIAFAFAIAISISIAKDGRVLDDSKSESSRFLDENVGSESHCLLRGETKLEIRNIIVYRENRVNKTD